MSNLPATPAQHGLNPTQRREAVTIFGGNSETDALASLASIAKNDPSPELRQLAADFIDNLNVVATPTDDPAFLAQLDTPAFDPNLFLIEPRNVDFVQGRTDRPTLNRVRLYDVLTFSAILIAGLGVTGLAAIQNQNSTLTTFALFWDGCMVLLIAMGIRTMFRNTYLAKVGRVLFGKVTWIDDSTDDEGNVSYEVRYQFTSPISKLSLDGKQKFNRHGMLPTSGTPVAVIFADDKCYKLL